jgi:hypothetical protein
MERLAESIRDVNVIVRVYGKPGHNFHGQDNYVIVTHYYKPELVGQVPFSSVR